MNKKLLLAGLLVSGAALAQTKPAPVDLAVPHWYAGAAAGQTIFDVADDSVAAPGATQSTLNEGKNQTGYRLFGGYRLHRNVAIEAALTDYGKFDATREGEAPAGRGVAAQTRLRGGSLELLGILPFGAGFSLIGKAGGMLAFTDLEYKSAGAFTLPAGSKTSFTNTELVAKYGVGLGYAATERVGLRVEYEVAKKVGEEVEGDMKALFFSVQYRF